MTLVVLALKLWRIILLAKGPNVVVVIDCVRMLRLTEAIRGTGSSSFVGVARVIVWVDI